MADRHDVSRVELLNWCRTKVGPCELLVDDLRLHGRTSVCRLRTTWGHCFLKIYADSQYWSCEVHAYEAWSSAFGSRCPELLAVRTEFPLALLVSELPGRSMSEAILTREQQEEAWFTAGHYLAALHALDVGTFFGPCGRNGEPLTEPVVNAQIYVEKELNSWKERGQKANCLSRRELAVVQEACDQLSSAFAGECPVPCHRDYCPVNWLVDAAGDWLGVIDFEFAYWDVRVADFSRYPEWEWIHQPHLLQALFRGYGKRPGTREEMQLLLAHVQYALAAVVWGHEAEFYGFADEGRQALALLAKRM